MADPRYPSYVIPQEEIDGWRGRALTAEEGARLLALVDGMDQVNTDLLGLLTEADQRAATTDDDIRARADAIVQDVQRVADEMLAAAREEGRREGLKEAVEIARSMLSADCTDAIAAIESRIASPGSGTAEREPGDE